MARQIDLVNAQTLWDYHCRLDNLDIPSSPESTIIIGLGSYDLRVAKYCANLYLKGYAKHLVFSGKSGNWTIGRWDKTEAEVFADVAIQMGVPRDAIILEKEATNIGENIQYTKTLLESLAIIPKQIILVTKPNTTRRAYACHMVYWNNIKPLLSAPLIEFNNPVPPRTTDDLISELVGDLERIIIYPDKGFQIKQVIPNEVINAYQELKQAGYNQHSTTNNTYTK